MEVDAESLTMHGIGRVVSSRSGRMRVTWSILVIISVAFASFFVSMLVTEYLKYETDLVYTGRVLPTMQFPVVTICNGLSNSRIENSSIFTEGFDSYIKSHKFFCRFNQMPCKRVNLTYHGKPHEESCLDFNFDETVYQTSPIIMDGLQIDFFINNSDQTPSFKDTYLLKAPVAKIYIHSSKEFSFLVKEMFVAKLGHMTSISLNKVRTSRQKHPYKSNCTEDKNKTRSYFPGNYTVMGCLSTIYQAELYKKCGYMIEEFKHYFSYEKLGDFVPFNETCLLEARNFGIESFDSTKSQPRHDCPLPCFEEKYEVKAWTEMKFPLEPQLSFFRKIFYDMTGSNVTDEYIYSSIGRVGIGYEEFKDNYYEEKPRFTYQRVLSEFGGLMGIYLGASFISMLEVVGFCVSLFWAFCKKFTNTKLRNSVTET